MTKGRRYEKDNMKEILNMLSMDDKRKLNTFRRLPKKHRQDQLRFLKTKKYKTRYDMILIRNSSLFY